MYTLKRHKLFLKIIVICLIGISSYQMANAQLPTLPTHEQLPSRPDAVADTGTYQISETYTPGSLEMWAADGLTQADEQGVFRASLNYQGDGLNDFEVRMGEGGQFYSIITPLGELIGRQHTYSTSFSRWNDAVIQSVVTNTNDPRVTNANCGGCNPNLTLNKNPDMNQGGTYIRDGLTEPFYSPHLRYERPSDTETRSIIWTPPSALPTTFQSGILYDQRTRNMGNGVLEITQLISNFGPDQLENRQTVPWLSLSGKQLDTYSYRGLDGAVATLSDLNWNTNVVSVEDTAGWIMFVDEDHPDKLGIAIINGGEKYAYDNDDVWRNSLYRFGDLNRPQWPDDTEYILSTMRSLNLYQDQTVFFRYYIAFGPQTALIELADQFANAADYGRLAYTEATAALTNLCIVNDTYTTENCTETTAVAHLYDYQVPGSKPVFVLRNTETDETVYTFDPYAISRVSAADPGRFYDGKTEYVEMLGWAIAADAITLDAAEYEPFTAETGDFTGLDGYLMRQATTTPLAVSTRIIETSTATGMISIGLLLLSGCFVVLWQLETRFGR